jgi:hypothetical protein
MHRRIFIRTVWALSTTMFIALVSPSVAWGQCEGEEPNVPEFDLSSAGAAIAMLAGSVSVLTARRKRRQTA